MLTTRIVPSVQPNDRTPRQVEREFRGRLAAGARLRPAGEARKAPTCLLSRGYTPKHRLDLFDTTFYLTNPRQNPDLRFFVAYVVQAGAARNIYPRIFYKDVSLVWRSASHFIRSEDENWIGKGDVRSSFEDCDEVYSSAEETTDLPLEIQTALETLGRGRKHVPRDEVAVGLVLRRGGNDRIEPYPDFSEPRRKAAAERRNLINGGRSIARFTRKNDPTSLRFVAGFEPDFGRGIIETSCSTSKLYGGLLQRFRVLSRNRSVQYLFFAGPLQVWIVPPQATTTELMSYGVRTVDVITDEDLCLPGYEYHFMDDSEDPPVLFSQIPKGFVGEVSELDPSRADASPWLDQMPIIREFRRKVLRARQEDRTR
jgi:hypothetical protein